MVQQRQQHLRTRENTDSQAPTQTYRTKICILRSPGDADALHICQDSGLEVGRCRGFRHQTGLVWTSVYAEARSVCYSRQDTN